MSYDYDAIQDLQNALEVYVELDGTEIGEACAALISLSGYPDYIGEECLTVVVKEMKEQLQNFQENYIIVEGEYTHTVLTRELELK
jgi:hypothetical protein